MKSSLRLNRYSFVTAIFVCFFLFAFALPMPLYAAGEIVGWGWNNYGQTTPPDGNDYIAVAGGYFHSLALKSDGSIVGWGFNTYGQATSPDGNNYTAIAAGGIHSLALKSDGSILGWGYNSEGQATPPTGNDYKAIAAGYEHSLALKTDGSIVGWGKDTYGQATPPTGNNYIAISAGGYHSIALKSDGSIVAWGYDNEGEVSNVPAGNNYIAISAGLYHNIALKSDGSMAGWGFNDHDRATPPAGNDYKAIAAGVWHNIALKTDGSLAGWGYDDHGQATPPAGNSFNAIASGGYHSLALKKNPYGGSGTLANPYRIATKADLLAMAASTIDYGKYFILTNNIDLGGQVFTTAIISPSNSPNGNYKGTPFTGVFDGNDHKITNFTINGGTTSYLGLFGFVGSGGQVKNLAVEDANITGDYAVAPLVSTIEVGSITNCSAACSVAGTSYVGGLVGDSYQGTLTNCHAAGSVSGNSSVGGLIAENRSGTLTSCYSTASVSGTSSSAGGLAGNSVGYSYGSPATITSCYATGAVIGTHYVGGLVGITNDTATITNSHATGIVTGTESVGGLIGYNGNPTAITSCYATGSVAGINNIGGLIGYNAYGVINSCYATGSATATEYAGGLMGWNHYGTLTSCYATGTVNGTDKYAGGLAAFNESGTITSCYATGSVSGNSIVGGLIGYDSGATTSSYSTGSVSGNYYVGGLTGYNNGTVTNCFWDTQTSGQPVSSGATGKTTAQMKTLSTFTDAGWDFSATDGDSADWQMLSNGYPRLIWEVLVPNVVGMTQTDANTAITAVDNLTIGTVIQAYSDTVTAGLVISQNPAGGTSVNIGSSVNLAISLGKPVVPNVVGMTQAAASSAVTGTSLTIGTITQQYSDTVAKGLVISQNPISGTSVNTGSSIDMVISLGYASPISVQKCSLTAGKDNLDSISLAGLFDATDSNFTNAMNGNLVVTIDSDTMVHSMTFTFPINATTYKKGKFSGKITNTSFSFDTKKHKFAFAAKKTNLTGLSCPITVTITIGNYAAQTQLEEAIVNGTKPTPFQLMMGVQNNLTVTKYKLKPGKVPGTDTLTAQGIFTINGAFNPAQPFVISIGSQTFTVPGTSFINNACKNIQVTEGGFVTAKLDTNKCTFTLSITKANINQTGEVDFAINCFGNNLKGLETIDLN